MIPRVGRRWCLTVALSAFWFCLPVGVCSAAVQATLYVASNGSDANPGTEAAPLATVDGARQAVRAVNKQMTGDIVVVLRGGKAITDWRADANVEFCYNVVWAHTRCKVASICREGDHAVVAMLQPYFTHARTKEGVQAAMPTYIEKSQ